MWEWECVCIISDQGHPPPPQCRDHNNIGTMDVAVSDKRHGPSSASSEVSTNIFCMFFCVCSAAHESWNIRQKICFRRYCLSGNFLIRFISLHQPARAERMELSENLGYFYSLMEWARVLGARRLTAGIQDTHSSHTGTVCGRGWCSTVSLRSLHSNICILYVPSKKASVGGFKSL